MPRVVNTQNRVNTIHFSPTQYWLESKRRSPKDCIGCVWDTRISFWSHLIKQRCIHRSRLQAPWRVELLQNFASDSAGIIHWAAPTGIAVDGEDQAQPLQLIIPRSIHLIQNLTLHTHKHLKVWGQNDFRILEKVSENNTKCRKLIRYLGHRPPSTVHPKTRGAGTMLSRDKLPVLGEILNGS